MLHLGGGLEAGLKWSNLDTRRKERNVASLSALDKWLSEAEMWIIGPGAAVHPRRASATH